MIEEIKQLRVSIDGLAQLTKELTPEKVAIIGGYKNSKEIEKAYDSLILAKAWLGKLLFELGDTSPYINDGKRKTIEDIEPTQDVFNPLDSIDNLAKTISNSVAFENWNHIEKVDWLRTQIESIINTEYITSNTYQPKTRLEALARTNSYNHLCEAKFWLGFELARIRENNI